MSRVKFHRVGQFVEDISTITAARSMSEPGMSKANSSPPNREATSRLRSTLEQACNLLEYRITNEVAVLIIHEFEVIDVKQSECQWFVILLRCCVQFYKL